MHPTVLTQRYEAADHGEDDEGTTVPMFVYDGPERDSDHINRRTNKPYRTRDYIGPKFTRTEAAIIAFALNAVADGFELQAKNRLGIDGRVFANELRTYDGPTDGVRTA